MQKFNELMSTEIKGAHLSRGLYVLSLSLFIFSAIAITTISKEYGDMASGSQSSYMASVSIFNK